MTELLPISILSLVMAIARIFGIRCEFMEAIEALQRPTYPHVAGR
jgi:hypothetical protein